MVPEPTIKQLPLPYNDYEKNEVLKKTIVIHHTASGPDPFNVVAGWAKTDDEVATPYVIAGPSDGREPYNDGDIFQTFDDKFWDWHLGVRTANYVQLNSQAVAIEICNWGPLTLKDGVYYNYVGGVVPDTEVIVFDTPYRGSSFYHKYTDAQIESLRQLVNMLCDKYNVSKLYNETMWDISNDALAGAPGIWTHTSYRTDKFDCSPQPRLVEMLKALNYNPI